MVCGEQVQCVWGLVFEKYWPSWHQGNYNARLFCLTNIYQYLLALCVSDDGNYIAVGGM
jgi:hypothetical protein